MPERQPQPRPEEDGAAAPDLQVAALRYEPDSENAPRMVAHGRGHAAQRIMEMAEQHDLPVRRDPTLVSILGALDVGAEIPPELYGVIAEVLAWAYHVDQAAADQSHRRAA
jgi:flagellar biosynthesis protein